MSKKQNAARSFKVSTEEVNTYGVIIRTAGGDFTAFLKNPVMLYNHDERCVIGTWENLRVEGTDLLADPVFDLEDDDAAKIAGKVERNVVKATSISLRPRKAQEIMLDDRSVIEVTKWELREISIATIPSNRSALRLLDENDQEIVLSDTLALSDIIPQVSGSKDVLPIKPNNSSMELKAMAVALKLAESATEAEVLTALNAAVGAQTELAEMKTSLAAQRKAEAVKLCDAAIADKRLTATLKDQFLSLADSNFELFKATLESLPKPVNLSAFTRQNGSAAAELNHEEEAIDLYDSLDKKGKLASLKKSDPDEFKRLFRAKYGKDPIS